MESQPYLPDSDEKARAGKLRCFYCKREGHGIRECESVVCNNCHATGHIKSRCPQLRLLAGISEALQSPGAEQMSSSAHFDTQNSAATHNSLGLASNANSVLRTRKADMKCFFCKLKGHSIADCEFKKCYPNEDTLCCLCFQPGHQASACTASVVCYRCYKPGHVSTECQAPVPLRLKPEEGTTSIEAPKSSAEVAVVKLNTLAEPGIQSVPLLVSTASTAGPAGSTASEDANATTLPPIDYKAMLKKPRAIGPDGHPRRVCVFISGPYFEGCLTRRRREPDPMEELVAFQERTAVGSSCAERGETCSEDSCVHAIAETRSLREHYSNVRTALQHTLAFIGEIFDMVPYAYWFDIDSSSLERVSEGAAQGRAAARASAKHAELISHMSPGSCLTNVAPRLVGRLRSGPTVLVNEGVFSNGWVISGIDTGLALELINCYDSNRFSQIVLLSGDGALLPAVQACEARRMKDPTASGFALHSGVGSTSFALTHHHHDTPAEELKRVTPKMSPTAPAVSVKCCDSTVDTVCDGGANCPTAARLRPAPVRLCGVSNLDSAYRANNDFVDEFVPRIFLDKAEHMEEDGAMTRFDIYKVFLPH